MNSVQNATGAAALFVGAIFMLVPRWLFGAGDSGSATVIFLAAAPVALAWFLSVRFAPHVLGPDDTARAVHGSVAYAVATGWGYGLRTALGVRSVAATLSGVVAHRIVFGINTLLILVLAPAHRLGQRRGSRRGRALRRGRRDRRVRRELPHARRSASLGPVRDRERRAGAGRGHPARARSGLNLPS